MTLAPLSSKKTFINPLITHQNEKDSFYPPTNFRETVKGILSCTVLALALTSLAACSSDDDDNPPADNTENPTTTLETPQYESVSAKYNITSASSDIKSIELTASGNYIITQNDVVVSSQPIPAKGRLAKIARIVTRASANWYDNIVEGKYTKISDTEFNLEGYGKLVIKGSTNNAVDLDITLKMRQRAEKLAQRALLLQRPQTGRVRRRDVDDEVVGQRGELRGAEAVLELDSRSLEQ